MRIRVVYTSGAAHAAERVVEKIGEVYAGYACAVDDGLRSLEPVRLLKDRRVYCPGGQYNAVVLIAGLPDYTVWVVDDDVFMPGCTWVFGAACTDGAGVVSTYRIPVESVAKVAAHEVGHILGLSHHPGCIMELSRSPADVLAKRGCLCEKCLEDLSITQNAPNTPKAKYLSCCHEPPIGYKVEKRAQEEKR